MQASQAPGWLMEGYYITKWSLQQGCQLAIPVEPEITGIAHA